MDAISEALKKIAQSGPKPKKESGKRKKKGKKKADKSVSITIIEGMDEGSNPYYEAGGLYD